MIVRSERKRRAARLVNIGPPSASSRGREHSAPPRSDHSGEMKLDQPHAPNADFPENDDRACEERGLQIAGIEGAGSSSARSRGVTRSQLSPILSKTSVAAEINRHDS